MEFGFRGGRRHFGDELNLGFFVLEGLGGG